MEVILFQVVWYLSLILAKVISGTTSNLEEIQVCLNSLADVFLYDKITLDFLLLSQDKSLCNHSYIKTPLANEEKSTEKYKKSLDFQGMP